MKLGIFLLGALLYAVLINDVSGNCLCKETGEDYCNCKETPRPVPKLIERIKNAKFPAIGDTCWCGKQLVQPAVPPKPPCKTSQPCKCQYAAPPPMPCYEQAPMQKPEPGVPADPVSVSLALRAGRAYAVPEAKLSFGPARLPLNALKRVYYSNLPEEKLFALNSEVIELRRKAPKKPEIIIEEEEEEEEAAAPSPYFTYGELGYKTEQYKNPQFMRYSSYAQPKVLIVKNKPQDRDCDYQPGKINDNGNIDENGNADRGCQCDSRGYQYEGGDCY